MTMSYEVGQSVQYIDTSGRQKAAIIIATHDSIEEPDPNDEISVIRPGVGFVHLAIFGIVDPFHTQPRPNVPTKEMAESIPDYTVDGKLVGYARALA